ncbi:hypothetical protein [Paenibacillus borealis]|uniref:hypothetical protein n=1 Tax=Paenibacillus borealis TaxID=160799 RepID=UPI0012FD446D|nr:hypothetical protein [Paenibacillus borealis]
MRSWAGEFGRQVTRVKYGAGDWRWCGRGRWVPVRVWGRMRELRGCGGGADAGASTSGEVSADGVL